MTTTEVTVELQDAVLHGDLTIPVDAAGMVLFAHGSGSSRHSPRNRAVAAGLNRTGFGTLLLDLLTPDEERADAASAALRFDIGLLTRRLIGAIDHLEQYGLPLGLFGASTGAAGALAAAAGRPTQAVVSRGGRPDLAGPALDQVRAPVLLLVGSRDPVVLELNQQASHHLRDCELRVVPGASHLFEEPGALEKVTAEAAEWFQRHLTEH